MIDATVAEMVGRRTPSTERPAARNPRSTKTHAGGEVPLGRHGEQWRVVHRVADRRVDTLRRRVREAFAEARDQLTLADLIPALERRDVDAVMERVPTLDSDTDLAARSEDLLADIVAEVARDTGRRIAADVIEAVADKSVLYLERKQDEDPPIRPSIPEEIASVEVFREFLERIDQQMSDDLSGRVGVTLSFDQTNPRAVEFARREAAEIVTQVSDETRRAIRQQVVRSFAEGVPPRRLAREIRDLGLGLTRRQRTAVANFRQALNSGDESTIRAQTSRRLDAATQQRIRSAAAEGRVGAELRDELVQTYADSMRNRRALNVARTETLNAANQGQQAAWEQAGDEGLLDTDRTRKVWIITPDSRLCSVCRPIPAMNEGGVKVDQAFETPVGSLMRPTAHPSGRCAMGLNFVEGDAVRREAG